MPQLEEIPRLVAKTSPAAADLIPVYDVTEAGNGRVKKVALSAIGSLIVGDGAPVNGASQVETATAALDEPTIPEGGVVAVAITSALFPGTRTYLVPVTAGYDVNDLALDIREFPGMLNDLEGKFTVSGSDAEIILTADVQAADDATMNIAIGGTGTTATAVTSSPTSVDTAGGEAPTPGTLGSFRIASGFLYAVSSVDAAGNPTWQKATLANL